MWGHQAKAVTWVYVTRSESAQSADAFMRHIVPFRCKLHNLSDHFCLVAPDLLMQSVDFAFFREGENRSFSLVPGDVIINYPNNPNPLHFLKAQDVLWTNSMSDWQYFLFNFYPNSTISRFWITV